MSRSARQQLRRDRYERAVVAARAQAGPTPFDAVWAVGRDMQLEQAIAEVGEISGSTKS
ncbi:MAG: hypothetical protein ABIV47_12515 [Roseiflexaceae bacterium]